MKSICLSICKQGWFGVPLFFFGIVSLAFSQLVQETETESLPPDQRVEFINDKLNDLSKILQGLREGSRNSFDLKKQSSIGNYNELVSVYGKNDPTPSSVFAMMEKTDETWQTRTAEIKQGINSVEARLNESKLILEDLNDNFAGRMEEAVPALNVLQENLSRTETEISALSSLSQNADKEALLAYSNIQKESDRLVAKALPDAPVSSELPRYSSKAEQVTNAINAKEAVTLDGSRRFSPSIDTSAGSVLANSQQRNAEEASEVINRLKSELAVSKSVQSELSADTSDLQGDLRKAYREIVSLQNNLKESELIIRELEETKNSLWQTGNGQYPTAQSVSGKIKSLERELQLAREDLRASRQTLLVEQERSNAMIRSVTNELERTRRDLDAARTAAMRSDSDSTRLASLERELNDARRALQMAKMAPMDSTQETYLTLQRELRSALSEITKMQIELGEKEELEAQLTKLKSSMETMGEPSSRAPSSEYVNKLLVDLNSAKREVEKAKSMNRQETKNLVEKIASLENELKISNLELEKTKVEFGEASKKIALREFEYATTIQRLEEEAQMTQSSLLESSLGKLPAIPFVDEMERNLAESEARIRDLSDRFESEQSKASEMIDGLQIELDSATIRQKSALEQLARREIDLKNKDLELKQSKEDAKKLKEELAVVKVIAGQLEDLNNVLAETKQTQNSQSGTMSQVVDSLKEELNQAKVELVFTIEEREKIRNDSSSKIKALEQQLEDTRNQLLAEQENLSDQTNDSKELVLDLKYELDLARAEIAKMKTAGLGESVEATQAVSQLQEALGTIRVLQESLDESEKVNLEVDNLRIELADAMNSQISELQKLEEQKAALRQKTIDLESEVALLREQGIGSGIQLQKSNSLVLEELKVSEAKVAELEKRLQSAEQNGVLSLIDLEEELASEKLNNQDLNNELSKNSLLNDKKVEILENELASALKKLENLEADQENRDSDLRSLQEELLRTKESLDSQKDESLGEEKDEISIVSQLEKQLIETQNKLAQIEAQPTFEDLEESSAYDDLEGELNKAEAIIAELQGALDSQNTNSQLLEDKLNNALSRLNQLEVANVNGDLERGELEIQNLKNVIIEKEKAQIDLEDKLNNALSRLNQLEVANVNGDLERGELEIQNLKNVIIEKEKTQIDLQNKLNDALASLEKSKIETDLNLSIESEIQSLQNKLEIAENKLAKRSVEKPEDVLKLDEELLRAQKTIDELMAKTEFEESARMELEIDLNDALKALDRLNQDSAIAPRIESNDEIIELKALISEKNDKLRDLEAELTNAITQMTEQEAELEVVNSIKEEMLSLKSQLDETKAQSKPNQVDQPEVLSKSEKEVLQDEIEQLKEKLTLAKTESNVGQPNEELLRLQKQLQVAVTESVEIQTELEETKARLAEMELGNSSGIDQEVVEKIISDAKEAELQAESRIRDLTNSLRNSERLREEMDTLLTDFQNKQKEVKNYSDDPRFIEMQKELVLLQRDLLAVRDLDNPEIDSLQNQLLASQRDSSRLNDEFKGAMEDFGRLKEQVAMLEEENNRLQNETLDQVRNDNNKNLENLRSKMSDLSRENSNLRVVLGEKDAQVSNLRQKLADAQISTPGISPDNAALRSQIVRLEGLLQDARDNESRLRQKVDYSDANIKDLNQQIALIEQKLRQSESASRGLPSTISSLNQGDVVPDANRFSQTAETEELRKQVQDLQSRLVAAQNDPIRNQMDRKIRDLNQKNLTAQIQLDQERSRVEDLKKQLADALEIKKGVLERGQSANLKVNLLNNELVDAKNRISSLENTLLAARQAIRVLKKDPRSTSFNVSLPKTQGFTTSSSDTQFKPRTTVQRAIPNNSNSRLGGSSLSNNFSSTPSFSSPRIQQIPQGNASLQLRAQVQFLNNKNRPAGFTEFFLVKNDLESIVRNSGVSIPSGQGIESGAELWARSVQRGYRYPGVASAIRNALATRSLARIKTNSIGESNLENLEPGNYFIVGASSLGQVGVVWSKAIQLKPGTNGISLDLRDAQWAE